MRLIFILCVFLVGLVGNTVGSFASNCGSDPNECTPKKLCEVATEEIDGNILWSNEAKHVTFAKKLGINCGVIDPCESDPGKCKIGQLCDKATTKSGDIKSWNNEAKPYVAMAKQYGLTCDVTAGPTNIICKLPNKNACLDTDLLCRFATKNGQWKKGSNFIAYVKEAKDQGLDCGVTKSLQHSTAELKTYFANQSLLKRKQIQYALKKLGYYNSSIDGLWGKGTSRALSAYLKDHNEISLLRRVYSSLVSAVDVPKSFVRAKNKSSASNQSNTNTSSSAKSDGQNIHFDCSRLSFSPNGFTTRAAAESWFPKEIYIVIDGEQKWMATSYGLDRDRSKNERQFNIARHRNGIHTLVVKGKTLSKNAAGNVSVQLQTQGYKSSFPARYSCKKGTPTTWEPKDD